MIEIGEQWVEHECNIVMTTGWNHDKQTVIDAWNRRV